MAYVCLKKRAQEKLMPEHLLTENNQEGLGLGNRKKKHMQA